MIISIGFVIQMETVYTFLKIIYGLQQKKCVFIT
jgi:hypothetical protein